MGDFSSAIQALESAIEIEPGSETVFYNLGRLYQDQEDWNQAADYYRKTIQIAPRSSYAHNNLGMIEREQGNIDKAIECYKKAIECQPDLAEAWNNLGTALQDQLKWPESVEHHRRAIELKPDYAQAHFNLGNGYRCQDQFAEAIDCYNRALTLDPDNADTLVNLGLAHQRIHQFDLARSYYQRALAIDTSSVEGHVNRAYLNRLLGNLADGWDEYEWRFQAEPQQRQFDKPLWNGQPRAKETLFVYAEQGIGDEVMFASCLPDVLEKIPNCIVECDPRLVPIYQRSFDSATIIASSDTGNHSLPPFDMQSPVGSLPRWTRRRLEDFPGRQSFLVADSNRVTQWKTRLADFGSKLKVGVSWRGGRKPETKRQRSTAIDNWASILNVSNAEFFNLQYGDCTQEIADCQRSTGVSIHNYSEVDPLIELEEFCAFISALDLVISIDNSTVHFAGALGKDVWTLLPFNPDWRWMLDREDSPWYPSMRLFRQSKPNDWENVFNEVADMLKHRSQLQKV